MLEYAVVVAMTQSTTPPARCRSAMSFSVDTYRSASCPPANGAMMQPSGNSE